MRPLGRSGRTRAASARSTCGGWQMPYLLLLRETPSGCIPVCSSIELSGRSPVAVSFGYVRRLGAGSGGAPGPAIGTRLGSTVPKPCRPAGPDGPAGEPARCSPRRPGGTAAGSLPSSSGESSPTPHGGFRSMLPVVPHGSGDSGPPFGADPPPACGFTLLPVLFPGCFLALMKPTSPVRIGCPYRLCPDSGQPCDKRAGRRSVGDV